MREQSDEAVDREDEDEDGEGEGTEKPDTTALDARLKAAEDTNARLLAVLRDADVTAVLAAKEGKKSLRIVVGEGEKADDGPPMPEGAELDAMSLSQALPHVLKGLARGVAGEFAEMLEPLNARLEEIETDVQGGRKERAEKAVADLTAKCPDWGEYKDTIKDLVQRGLDPKEAYMVARQRSGKEPLPRLKGAERPSYLISSDPPVKSAKARKGPRGFSADLNEVLEKQYREIYGAGEE